MEIKITIPTNKLTEFKAGFAKGCQVNENIVTKEFVKYWLKQSLINCYQAGKKDLIIEDANIPVDVVEVE